MPTALLILLPVLLLTASTLLIILFRIWRPRFAYYWLAGTFPALFAWLGIFLIRPALPLNLTLSAWRPVEIFPLSPQLNVDAASWLFSLAAVTILLAVNLTGLVSPPSEKENTPDWMSLAGAAGITVLSILVMYSGNLVTILLTWMLIDIVEFIIYLSLAKDRKESEQTVVKFSLRAAGLLIGIYAGIDAAAQGAALTFDALSPLTSGLLILAVSVRIGLIPNTPILPYRLPTQAGYGALLRLVATAAHFPLLVKAAQSGASPQMQTFLWVWTGLTALLSAFSWISANNSQAGRHYWIIALSSLVVASSSSAQPQAVIAFGWSLLLPGSLIFLSNYRNRWSLPLLFLGGLAISSLPYTPTWQSVELYTGSFHVGWLLLLPAHSLILLGFLKHSFTKKTQNAPVERWAAWIYTWGLVIITLVTYLFSWWMFSGNQSATAQTPDLFSSWPALAILGITVFTGLIHRRIPAALSPILTRLSVNLSLGRALKPVWGFFFWVRKILLFVSQTLESQSGILWALLILVLLISLFGQVS